MVLPHQPGQTRRPLRSSGQAAHRGRGLAIAEVPPRPRRVRGRRSQMGAGHDHARGSGASSGARTRLAIALSITAVTVLAQAVGSPVTGSLALLTDTAHALVDASGLLVALIAATMMLRPASSTRTWGLRPDRSAGGAGAGPSSSSWSAPTQPSRGSRAVRAAGGPLGSAADLRRDRIGREHHRDPHPRRWQGLESQHECRVPGGAQ